MRQPKITVVGSLNMDIIVSVQQMPREGETLQGDVIHYLPGGKGSNQAVGCAKLGANTHMIGAVGTDAFGDQILNDLQRYGIPIHSIARSQESPTGIATIIHTPSDNCIVIVPGANGEVDGDYIDKYADLIRQSDVMLVQLEIPAPAVERALMIAKEAGVVSILNPAPAKKLSPEILKLATVLTPNETEFESLCGYTLEPSESNLHKAMLAWEIEHSHKLVITRGKHGVSFMENQQLRTIPAPIVTVKDTTGAGDCFNAALSYGLASLWPWEQAVTFAVKVASISVTRFGAQEGMPYMNEVI